MTNRERVHAALEGRPGDRVPVASLYHFLYWDDHFAELTGLPAWRRHWWHACSPEEYVRVFSVMREQTPFELLQPHGAPARAWRDQCEFAERDGVGWCHNRKTGSWQRLDARTASGHATDYHANETQHVFDREDVRRRVTVSPAEALVAEGRNDYAEAVVGRFGREEFVVTGGVIGTFYLCHAHFGLTNLFALVVEQPDLVAYLSARLLEQNIEIIRQHAAAGGDAVYIDDACTTCDLISVAHYERFSLPYMRAMVEEIHRQGMKAILIYFGGIADRLEQIASLGADGLLFETSMKGYVNDVREIAGRIGRRVTPFGNLDPVGVLQNGTDEALEQEVRRQHEAGRLARGFVLSTSSPITPATPLARVQRYLALGGDGSMGQ